MCLLGKLALMPNDASYVNWYWINVDRCFSTNLYIYAFGLDLRGIISSRDDHIDMSLNHCRNAVYEWNNSAFEFCWPRRWRIIDGQGLGKAGGSVRR